MPRLVSLKTLSEFESPTFAKRNSIPDYGHRSAVSYHCFRLCTVVERPVVFTKQGLGRDEAIQNLGGSTGVARAIASHGPAFHSSSANWGSQSSLSNPPGRNYVSRRRGGRGQLRSGCRLGSNRGM